MIWLLRDFDLLAVLLHAAALACEAVLLGGVAFLLLVLRDPLMGEPAGPWRAGCRLMQWAAGGLVLVELATMGITSASMVSGSNMALRELLSAGFLWAESATILLSVVLGGLARACANDRVHERRSARALAMVPAGLGLLASIVYLSHAASQMDHRVLLAVLTALHHLGTAAWIGAMPYLLLFLARSEDEVEAGMVLRRFSAMALVSVATLVAAGVGMAWYYVGSVNGLYGTTYGLMLLAKISLMLLMLTMGAGNWYLLRPGRILEAPLVLRLRRFSEAELGIGFIVLLAAASLTAQSPAVDMARGDMVSAHAYRQQMAPRWPVFSSPPFHALTPPSSMRQGVEEHQFGDGPGDDANDKAWSNYNHHWAGLMVLLAGALALVSRYPLMRGRTMRRLARWARYWPFSFIGLAFFIVLRADPEAWPLGPRPFWASFSYPDVLEHRLEAVLIIGFAVFEAAVQSGALRKAWATLVFPLICALGAALLLTHSHGLGNMLAEVLAEASHTMIAVLGATVAAARWLDLRLPAGRQQRLAGVVWPTALMLVSLVLLNYREV